MDGRYLLDTSVVIPHLNHDPEVNARVSRLPETFIPVIVMGELYFGAAKSAKATENLVGLQRFAARMTILHCDLGTAKVYGHLKHELRTLGRPIPENDLWIGALARQHQLTLVSRDEHFSQVPDLRLEMW